MIDLTIDLAIREGFALVIAGLIPLLAAAAVAGAAFGWLGAGLGLRDAALGQIARALAVILALGLIVGGLAEGLIEFAERSWAVDARDLDPGRGR